jgi:FtsP/CotA-like multicopper oxidase with cupredoxin domain
VLFQIFLQGVHRNDHYGDINLISGKPFPVLAAQPKWMRFRVLNGASSRPWLLTIVNNNGQEISSKICYVSVDSSTFVHEHN